jgi:hypothetical protein
MSLLEEMTQVVLSRPSHTATPAEVAAWYHRKAALLDRIAGERGVDSAEASTQAATARERARRLLSLG